MVTDGRDSTPPGSGVDFAAFLRLASHTFDSFASAHTPPQQTDQAGSQATSGSPGVSTCGVCPVCLGLATVAKQHPEVLGHLGEAVTALGKAISCLTRPDRPSPATPDEPPGAPDTPWGRSRRTETGAQEETTIDVDD